jgi:hypothetical protein
MQQSRRMFLGFAAAMAAGCTRSTQPPAGPPAPTPTPTPDERPRHSDKVVATKFLDSAKWFDHYMDRDKDTFAAINFYGLMLLNSKDGEILMPNSRSTALPSGQVHPHYPRLWARAPYDRRTSTAEPIETEGDLNAWDLTNRAVRFEWHTSSSIVTETNKADIKEAHKRHPWRLRDVIPDICDLASARLIPANQRKLPGKVSSYVGLGNALVIPGLSWSASGQVSEWQHKRGADKVGDDQATTDNITALRKAPTGFTKLRVVLTDFESASTTHIDFPVSGVTQLPLAVTHAERMERKNLSAPRTVLRHMVAYALLTDFSSTNYANFPIAHFVMGVHGETEPPAGVPLSDDDGHCTFCGCN